MLQLFFMKKIYCVSGLGADERAFARIRVPGYTLVHLPWLEPLPAEPLPAYARRMAASIPEEQPVLMGLSFGGMLCMEIAKFRAVARVILISSVSTRHQLPRWMRWAGRLRLHRIVPLVPDSRWLEPVQNHHLGVQDPQDLEMVRRYRQQVSRRYLRWAVDCILRWQNEEVPPGTVQLHGDADRIFPIKQPRPDYVIPGGTHLMVTVKAREINRLLQQVLAEDGQPA